MIQSNRFGGQRSKGVFKKSLPLRPLITIVTVVFNAAHYLEQAILSIIKQKYENIEYIVIDGGSNDGTLAIINKYEKEIDYWVSEKDDGIYDAMNKALSVANGDWLIFIGADDELLVDIEILVTKMMDYRAIYYGDVKIKNTNQLTGGGFSKYKIMQQNICHQSIFYPRYIYTSKPYDTEAGMLADYKYNLELFGEKVNFKYTRMLISLFNDQGQSSGDQTYFIPIAMTVIKNRFGMLFYSLKRIRNLFAKLVHRKYTT